VILVGRTGSESVADARGHLQLNRAAAIGAVTEP